MPRGRRDEDGNLRLWVALPDDNDLRKSKSVILDAAGRKEFDCFLEQLKNGK